MTERRGAGELAAGDRAGGFTARLRPGALLEARMVAAYRDGEATARGRRPRLNPWNGLAGDAAERVLCRMWARGYSAGNPVRLDGR